MTRPPPRYRIARSGGARAYAVTAAARSLRRPEIPTARSSLPGFHVSIWQGLFAPKAREGDHRQRSTPPSSRPWPTRRAEEAEGHRQELPTREQQTPEGFGAYTRPKVEKWWRSTRAANISPQLSHTHGSCDEKMALRIGLVVRRNRAANAHPIRTTIILVVPRGVGGSTDVIGG